MQASIEKMTREICCELQDKQCSIYLLGSASLGDFREGWSDIDILCLTDGEVDNECMERLVDLRQRMLRKEPYNPYYRLFEGMILPLEGAVSGCETCAVYWGTSGQRIRRDAVIGVFERLALLEHAQLLHGEEVRHLFARPDRREIRAAIQAHCAGIARVCCQVPVSMYTSGWMLDIARCLYTLETGKLIGKTQAGEWALVRGLCPEEEVMESVLALRRAPKQYGLDCAWRETLPASITRYCNYLLDTLARTVDVEIDRPIGSVHPTHRDMIYPLNYGYVPGVMGGDGEEQDAYIMGIDVPVQRFTGEVIAVIHRKDDNEDKWVVAPMGLRFSETEIRTATWFTEQYFDSEIRMTEVKQR